METALEFLKEHLRLMATVLGGPMATALEFLKERLSDVGELMATTLGGLMATAFSLLKENSRGYAGPLQDKRKEIEEAFTSQFLQEKLPWLIVLWKSAVDYLVQKLEAFLPPGTSSDTVRFWVQLVMPLLLFLSLRYFFCAVYRAIKMIKAVARAVWGTIKGGGGKMMKAPGRPGRRIPRDVFESDPRNYFRGLHANDPWQEARPNSKSKWFIVGAGVVFAGVVLRKLL